MEHNYRLPAQYALQDPNNYQYIIENYMDIDDWTCKKISDFVSILSCYDDCASLNYITPMFNFILDNMILTTDLVKHIGGLTKCSDTGFGYLDKLFIKRGQFIDVYHDETKTYSRRNVLFIILTNFTGPMQYTLITNLVKNHGFDVNIMEDGKYPIDVCHTMDNNSWYYKLWKFPKKTEILLRPKYTLQTCRFYPQYTQTILTLLLLQREGIWSVIPNEILEIIMQCLVYNQI